MSSVIGRLVQLWIVPISLLLLWEILVRCRVLPKELVAPPSAVALSFLHLLASGELLSHVLVSLQRLSVGYLLGCSLGIFFGISVAQSKLFSRLFEPTILALLPVPPIAWIPLLIILFGIGDMSKTILIALGSFCTLFFQTSYGIRTADANLIEVATALCKKRSDILFSILLPSALPNILSSMRTALALSWTLLLCAELIASSRGVGWLIWDSRNFSRSDEMIAGMLTVASLGFASDSLLVAIERHLTRWKVKFGETNGG